MALNDGYNAGQGVSEMPISSAEALSLSPEEGLVIRQLRQLKWGEVVVEKKAGQIVFVRSRKDIKVETKTETE